ncbi:metallopeptidase family protein [Candidatus Methylomirabilis sp.]|uniref:Metallopeptidase family protein n=1 Tax=Candidatus Methylomirabilis tolerans TaxID=3123416 RepID=A0AAJ1AGB6_9BACT|nr:metallopeptidase family protein [Candidatus Methylomirabilis sp.]
MALSHEEFRQLVALAIASLPPQVVKRLANVEIVVKVRPTSEELAMTGTNRAETLFGLYTGIPLTKRSSSYGMVLPDKITLYQRSIEEGCRTKEEIQMQIRTTLLHEIGHHFGLSEDELEQVGYE